MINAQSTPLRSAAPGRTLAGWIAAALVGVLATFATFAQSFLPTLAGTKTEIYGIVEAMPTGTHYGRWTIAGRTVDVTTSTQLKFKNGVPRVGMFVEVEGALATDGSVSAWKLSTKRYKSGEIVIPGGPGTSGSPATGTVSGTTYFEIRGAVESIPNTGWAGQWRIGGVTVLVDGNTWLEAKAGNPVLGGWVEVKAVAGATPADPPRALKIKTKSAGSSSSPVTGTTSTSFYGMVEAMPTSGIQGIWTISGRQVIVDAATYFERGVPTLGAYVEVKTVPGATPADLPRALKIEIKSGSSSSTTGPVAVTLEFYGTVQTMPTGSLFGVWSIAGRQVTVDSSTYFETGYGMPTVGSYVEVKAVAGATAADLPRAIKIETKRSGTSESVGKIKWKGILSAMSPGAEPGTQLWTVGGQNVVINAATTIKSKYGPIAIGQRLEVKARRDASGQLIATKVERDDD